MYTYKYIFLFFDIRIIWVVNLIINSLFFEVQNILFFSIPSDNEIKKLVRYSKNFFFMQILALSSIKVRV